MRHAPRLALAACVGLFLLCPAGRAAAGDAVLVADGTPRAAIFVPPRLLDDAAKNPEPAAVWRDPHPEANRRRLRESVKDLAAILQRVSGARVEVVAGKPGPGDGRLPVLVGELAAERFGKPKKSYPYRQGFRIVASEKGVGLAGESDLATSYAVYTLLEQLGCRWYMPSPLGEVLPALRTVKVKEQDLSTGPYTVFRGMWYCDNDFARRTRMGGMELAAGHNLEFAVPKELRKTHPEIRAVIHGKPSDHRVKWTHPLVAKAVADACLAQLAKDPDLHTYSLSPNDGIDWDESDDRKYDAGDFDPAAGCVSKTDRLMVFANRVARMVTAKHPDVKLGILAYADYTRPPVRQKVHPALVPEIAPITFSRAQPMDDDGEPNNKALRALVEGWARAVPEVSYYFYAYYLAEVSCPNPMITRWGHDIPYVYTKGNCKYWQPETITNFETSLHAHCLGLRLAWDLGLDPKGIIRELHEKFYGAAAKEMADYWHYLDEVWVKTPEYAGCGFGHLRRWPEDKLARARQLVDRAAAACKTDAEKARVRMASDSLGLFERFMRLRRDLAAGRFGRLATDAAEYRTRAAALGERYKPQYAFGQMGWTIDPKVQNIPSTINVRYFDAFYKATYDDAARVAAQGQVLTDPPLRRWRYRVDQGGKGEAAGWMRADFDDRSWKTTDCAVDTWSDLGLHNYRGPMWYRTRVAVPAVPGGKKVYLWVGATDGRVKVFVGGKHVPYVGPKGERADSFSGYCQPVSFDITGAIRPGAENQVSLLCTREALNELGTGGLLAPVVLYRER
jgi:hypothetical protein